MRNVPPLNEEDLSYLKSAFSDLLNYAADDLDQPIDPLTYLTPEGDTCLHIAAARGDLRAIRLLIACGLDPNAKGDMGATPLHSAHLSRQSEAAKLLTSLGADENLKDEFGRTPGGQ
jgi:ankyrin repeat protein